MVRRTCTHRPSATSTSQPVSRYLNNDEGRQERSLRFLCRLLIAPHFLILSQVFSITSASEVSTLLGLKGVMPLLQNTRSEHAL